MTPEKKPELKPCKCGKPAEYWESINYCWVECTSCWRHTRGFTDYKEAALAWNENNLDLAKVQDA